MAFSENSKNNVAALAVDDKKGKIMYYLPNLVRPIPQVNIVFILIALSRQNLSSGFLKNRDSNRSTELQRLARILKFCLKQV